MLCRRGKKRHKKYPSVRFVGAYLSGAARLVQVHKNSGLVRAGPQHGEMNFSHLRSLGFPITLGIT